MRGTRTTSRALGAGTVLLVLVGVTLWSWSGPRRATTPLPGSSPRTVLPGTPALQQGDGRTARLPAEVSSNLAILPQKATEQVDVVQAVVGRGGEQIAGQLERVIREEREPYLRERAVFGLVEVSQRASLPLLRELALRDRDPNVRSAALANFQLLKERYPEPPKGTLHVEATGAAHAGGLLRIDATLVSTVDVEHARLHVMPPPGLDLVAGPRGWKGRLRANQPERLTFEVYVKEAGNFQLPLSLTLAWTRVDYEQIRQVVVLDAGTGDARVEAVPKRR